MPAGTTAGQRVTLRRATAADVPAIWSVRTRAIRSGCQGYYPEDILESWASNPMPSTFDSLIQTEPYYVAESQSGVVGFAGLKRTPSELDAVFVAPDRARCGIGMRLLCHVEAVARDLGLVELTLKASLNSVPFYQRAGYSQGANGTHSTTSGLQIACVHMGKFLVGEAGI